MGFLPVRLGRRQMTVAPTPSSLLPLLNWGERSSIACDTWQRKITKTIRADTAFLRLGMGKQNIAQSRN